MKTIEDINTIDAMIRYGGSFVSTLGLAAQHADKENLAKIKKAWPNYWEEYRQMAERKNHANAH